MLGRRQKMVTKKFQTALSSSAFKIAALIGEKEHHTSSFMEVKKNMYGVSESFQEGEEDNESNSESDCFPGNQVAAEGHTEEDSFDVRKFRGISLDVDVDGDIESQMGAPIVFDKDESKDSDQDESLMKLGKEKKSSNSIDSNIGSNTSNNSREQTKSDNVDFYKVTKAAQMWKKKSEVESNVQTQPSTPPSSQPSTRPPIQNSTQPSEEAPATSTGGGPLA
jgi:hypothetical protein